jgi:hypothetical protein
MKNALFNPNKEVHSLELFIIMTPFSFKEGSFKSVRFLIALKEKAYEIN